ncbi:MAG: hypothetical protein RLZZ04_1152 [Cyanobacteriota bacterium]|jgi:hypothetical protein
MTNLSINIRQDKSICQELTINPTNNRQPSHRSPINLQAGQKVYLHGDTQYTGTLIRPIERTYPPKWTVELDVGGYEAVNLERISLIESWASSAIETNLEIPFGDEPEVTNSQKEREIIALRKEVSKLRQENEIIKKDLDQAKQILRRAKDLTPLSPR